MARLVLDLRFTLVATVAAAAIVWTHADLLTLLAPMEKYGANTVFCGLAVICAGVLIDLVFRALRRRRQAEAEAQKLRTHQATMRTVLHIVNNFLNGLLLFELEAEPVVSRRSFEELERLVQQTHQNLKALADLEVLREITTPTGDAIELPNSSSASLVPGATPGTTFLQ